MKRSWGVSHILTHLPLQRKSPPCMRRALHRHERLSILLKRTPPRLEVGCRWPTPSGAPWQRGRAAAFRPALVPTSLATTPATWRRPSLWCCHQEGIDVFAQCVEVLHHRIVHRHRRKIGGFQATQKP